jgi:tetratricopeptide (TPR) repeat protein
MSRLALSVSLSLVLSIGAASAQRSAPGPDGRRDTSTQIARLDELLNEWDVEGAAQELEKLARTIPADSEPMKYYRGRVAFELGRYEEAVRLLGEAGISDRPGSYLRLATDTLAVVKDHQRIESEHFVFSFPPGRDAVLAPYALESLEAIRKALVEDLGYAPPGKVRVEVVNNGAELARVSTLTLEQIRTTGTIAICKFNKLMVTSPKAVLRGYDWLDTLAHEYIHLVVSRQSRNKVPIWLHEGLAKYLESRWRGAAGQALSPSSQALLGRRLKEDKLIPFEKMHPSMALLPTAEDAATAFAEVFFVMDYLHRAKGNDGLRTLIHSLRDGRTDRQAMEAATGQSFAGFERAWLAHVRKQQFPKELLPLEDRVVLKEDGPKASAKKEEGKKGRDVTFGQFAYVTEVPARRAAHLGELLRERRRVGAAAVQYARAHSVVGDKYETISNKYALTLLELGKLDEAERVLTGSLRVHPGVASTHVHLGRIHLARGSWKKAKAAYTDALAINPFDPEVHLALHHAHLELGEEKGAERTRRAVAVLARIPAESVSEAAAKFAASRELVEPDLPEAAPGDGAPQAPKPAPRSR